MFDTKSDISYGDAMGPGFDPQKVLAYIARHAHAKDGRPLGVTSREVSTAFAMPSKVTTYVLRQLEYRGSIERIRVHPGFWLDREQGRGRPPVIVRVTDAGRAALTETSRASARADKQQNEKAKTR